MQSSLCHDDESPWQGRLALLPGEWCHSCMMPLSEWRRDGTFNKAWSLRLSLFAICLADPPAHAKGKSEISWLPVETDGNF